MKIKSGIVEEQQRSQLTNDNTISVKQRKAELDRKGLEQLLGATEDTVSFSAAKEINRSIGSERAARIAELRKLFEAGQLHYDSGIVAQAFTKHVDEEVAFDKLLEAKNGSGGKESV